MTRSSYFVQAAVRIVNTTTHDGWRKLANCGKIALEHRLLDVNMKPETVIISRQLAPDARAAALESELADRLREAGFSVIQTPHLYHVREESPFWAELAKQASDGVIVFSWLHPRPAEWLLRRHAVGGESIAAFNLNAYATADACWGALQQAMETRGYKHSSTADGRLMAMEDAAAVRWYPVVDQARCVNCHHCLQFCLFGVYTKDEVGHLLVRNPDRCKPGCPACSRICPEGAIMFPLCKTDPAIAGAPGLLMSPDAAARRMFYTRTKKPCPVCGQTPQAQKTVKAKAEDLCPECGGVRPQPAAPVAAAAVKKHGPPVHDDLDALVDQLDDVMRRKT